MADYAFLSNPSWWRPDTKNYVFLPRANDEIGKAKFDTQWTGSERSAFTLDMPFAKLSLPTTNDNNDVSAWQLIERLLNRRDPDRVLRSQAVSDQNRSHSLENWDIARSTLHEIQAAERRYEAVIEQVIAGCAGGKLESAIARTGHDPTLCDARYWYSGIDYLRGRFYFCRLDPDEPLDDMEVTENPSATDEPRYQWIYISRRSLNRFLGSGPGRPIGSPNPAPLAKHDNEIIRRARVFLDEAAKSGTKLSKREAVRRARDDLGSNLGPSYDDLDRLYDRIKKKWGNREN